MWLSQHVLVLRCFFLTFLYCFFFLPEIHACVGNIMWWFLRSELIQFSVVHYTLVLVRSPAWFMIMAPEVRTPALLMIWGDGFTSPAPHRGRDHIVQHCKHSLNVHYRRNFCEYVAKVSPQLQIMAAFLELFGQIALLRKYFPNINDYRVFRYQILAADTNAQFSFLSLAGKCVLGFFFFFCCSWRWFVTWD